MKTNAELSISAELHPQSKLCMSCQEYC